MDRSQLVLSALAVGAAAFMYRADAVHAADKAHSGAKSKTASIAATAQKETQYGSHLEPILKAIDATPVQRKQISEVVEEFRPKIQPMRIQYRSLQAEFLNAMTSARPPEEIMLKQSEMNEEYGRIVNEYCVMHLKIRRYLNTEQCANYEKYRHSQGWK